MGIAIAKFDEWYGEIKQTLNKDRPDELFAKIEVYLVACETQFKF